jgi:hypothetical protein
LRPPRRRYWNPPNSPVAKLESALGLGVASTLPCKYAVVSRRRRSHW